MLQASQRKRLDVPSVYLSVRVEKKPEFRSAHFFYYYYFFKLRRFASLLITSVGDPYVFGPPRSATGSVSQRHGSEDPDPYQNVTEP
jgi:hypothetical protein